MFKSLDSIASVVGIFMYLTISKFKQVLRSRKGLNYNTDICWHELRYFAQILEAQFIITVFINRNNVEKA